MAHVGALEALESVRNEAERLPSPQNIRASGGYINDIYLMLCRFGSLV